MIRRNSRTDFMSKATYDQLSLYFLLSEEICNLEIKDE